MNNNRDLFTGNLTAEPELNCPLKGTVVVNASLANNELYISEGGGSRSLTFRAVFRFDGFVSRPKLQTQTNHGRLPKS